ncbi:MAG: hypothetical protein JOZ32_21015, partial [Bryobacterales bacterium]|nr:hypothetical protein [Bryobacterales bacterium]
MTKRILIVAAISFTGPVFQTSAATVSGTPTPASALVTKYCNTCHSQKLKKGNLVLENADAVHVYNSAETWEKVIVKLR